MYGATGAANDNAPMVDEAGKVMGSDKGIEVSTCQMYGLVALLCAASISEGYDLGVVNGAIVRIQEHFQFSTSQVGFIVAVAPAFSIVGALLHGAIADHFGRRVGLLSAVAFLISGPAVMASAQDLVVLLIGRMLVGIGIGAGMLVVTIYVAELAPASQRGRLVACQEVALNAGIVLGFFMAWLLVGQHQNDWRRMLLIGSILPLPLVAMLLFIYCTGAEHDAILPETPRWLLMHGYSDSAHKVASKFHGTSEKSFLYLQQEYLQESEQFVPWSKLLCPWSDRPLLRMLATGILVAVGEMICGGTSIGYYSTTIMEDDLGRSSAYLATVVMGVVRLVGVSIATLAIDNVGRRTLLLSSAAIMMVACIWIALTAGHLTTFGYWMLPFGLWLMMLGFVIGLGSVSLVYISEIFPTRMRQKGMVICMFWCRFGGASCAVAYPILIDRFGISATFVVQAGINFVLLSLLYVMVVETKGLSLEESCKIFDNKSH